MRRTMIAIGTTASAALAGFLIAAAPVAATTATNAIAAASAVSAPVADTARAAVAETAAAARRTSKLTLTVQPNRGQTKVARLNCKPVGGNHPRAADACAALTTANGDPTKLTPEDLMCTAEFAPVRARVVGFWEGRPVSYQKTFSNSCQLRIATGAVFALS